MRCSSIVAIFTMTLLASGSAVAQSADPISQAVKNGWQGAKRNIVDSAKLMPEDGYAFRPVDTVRTFGQILAHVAGANYELCAAAKGEKSPFTEDHFEKTAKTKAEIQKALDDSFAYCDAVYNSLTDAKAAEPIGPRKVARVGTLVGNTGHLQEHYGNLVTYFRVKGMVPPSSARQSQ